MSAKLKNDLQNLVEANVISEVVASKIERYYASQQSSSTHKLFVVFGVLGSLLVGLGLILILAHNWDAFSKSLKTIIAYLPLLVGQLAVGYSLFASKSATWKESSGTFLFFAIGACISLISQIYNIPGQLSSYLLTWLLLCLPVLYLLQSNILAILHIVFATYYGCEVGYFSGGISAPWYYLVLMGLIVPFYIKQLKNHAASHGTIVLHWLLPLSISIVLGTFITRGASFYGAVLYMLWFGVLYNLGELPFFKTYSLFKNGYKVIGSLGMVVVMLFASFKWFWKEVSTDLAWSETGIMVVVLALIALLFLYKNARSNALNWQNSSRAVFIVAGIIFIIGLNWHILAAVLSNLLVLVMGILITNIGVKRTHFGILNYGLLVITALIICRFFDTNLSFVLRGLLFIVVGTGFFIANYTMLKRNAK